jgi:hypothetical protein
MGGGLLDLRSGFPSMFNFSANHLFLLSRIEYCSCALLLMLDADTRRVYRLFDFTKRLRPIPGRAYCVAGKVNSVNTLYLVVESIKLDSKHRPSSTAPIPNDGAGGLPLP